jgi:protein ImuB
MQRVASLFLPTWSTDRVRRKLGSAVLSAEASLVLIGSWSGAIEGDGWRWPRMQRHSAPDCARYQATKAQALVPI